LPRGSHSTPAARCISGSAASSAPMAVRNSAFSTSAPTDPRRGPSGRAPGGRGKKFADFHALSHSYLTALAAGVGVKELQTLARHADPRVTLGIYTHARPEALGASVARLKLP
jgi:hypothetical protein